MNEILELSYVFVWRKFFVLKHTFLPLFRGRAIIKIDFQRDFQKMNFLPKFQTSLVNKHFRAPESGKSPKKKEKWTILSKFNFIMYWKFISYKDRSSTVAQSSDRTAYLGRSLSRMHFPSFHIFFAYLLRNSEISTTFLHTFTAPLIIWMPIELAPTSAIVSIKILVGFLGMMKFQKSCQKKTFLDHSGVSTSSNSN